MYTTIEADVENGQLKGAEVGKLPAHAHVLITLLGSLEDRQKGGAYDFSELAGKLKWRGDAVKVQRELRDEW
ncbi:MAG: hypothetical protein ABFR33_07980 [Verrucomicrobiota bacterium]